MPSPPAAARAKAPASRLSWVLLSLIVLAIAVQTVRSMAAHRLALTDPAAALAWSPGDGEAAAMLASRALAVALKTGDSAAKAGALESADRDARRAIRLEPLRAESVRDLGLVADTRGQVARAEALMSQAALFGWRDVATQAWLLRQSLTKRDLAGAMTRIDAILRTQPDLQTQLLPVVAAILGQPDGREPVAAALAAMPPWREFALGWLPLSAADPESLVALDSDLARRGHPVSSEQIGYVLSRLVQKGRYEEAHALWLAALPTSARPAPGALLFDGELRGPGAPAPFGWSLVQPSGGRTGLELVSGRRALAFSYPAAATSLLAEQLLTAPAGTYRLRGQWRIDDASGGAGLSWTVSCAGAARAPLVDSRQAADVKRGWTTFEATFTAPADCPAQWLRLIGQSGDGFGDVSGAYAHLTLERAP